MATLSKDYTMLYVAHAVFNDKTKKKKGKKSLRLQRLNVEVGVQQKTMLPPYHSLERLK